MLSRLSQTVKGESVNLKHANSHRSFARVGIGSSGLTAPLLKSSSFTVAFMESGFILSPSMVFWSSAIQARKPLFHQMTSYFQRIKS